MYLNVRFWFRHSLIPNQWPIPLNTSITLSKALEDEWTEPILSIIKSNYSTTDPATCSDSLIVCEIY